MAFQCGLCLLAAEVNQQVEVFAEELTRKTDENSRQKEEITAHLAQLVDLQKRVRCVRSLHFFLDALRVCMEGSV